jgi:hypothetical protein
MTTSSKPVNGAHRPNGWLRRSHRWLGVGLALFLLLLSCTGIALNHSDDWNLDSNYVSWPWLLDAYGIRAPALSANFSDREHHAALLGQRLYFDEREIADGVGALTGLIVTGELAMVTSGDRAFVLTMDGELVEQLDVSPRLPGAIERLGRMGERAVISSTGRNFRSDSDLSGFEAWSGSDGDDVAWSRASPLPAPLLISLQDQYRGRGLTIERLLIDIHSGRIVGTVGPLLMDLVALLLIVLSLTGLTMWMRASRPGNGS